MKKEKSCGAVIFKRENNQIKFLLIQQVTGHWTFPKGHVQGGETEEETALREIFEETGLKVKLDNNFRQTVSFSPKEGVIKDVIYFVAEVTGGIETPQLSEVKTILWLDSNEARKMITYDNTRDLFDKANIYLEGLK